MSETAQAYRCGVLDAHPLFSHRKMTGSLQITARFTASCTGPRLAAPSPKKHRQTWPLRRCLIDSPTPAETVRPPATTPLAPSTPTEASAMCMDPPFPRHEPVRLA